MSVWDKTMVVHDDGSVTFPGIDYSNKGPMLIVHRLYHKQFGPEIGLGGDKVIVRHPGGSCWAGVGSAFDYVPVHFLVFEIIEPVKRAKNAGEKWWRVRELATITPGKMKDAMDPDKLKDLL